VVLTPYGTGIMKGVRPIDGVHVVAIKQVSGRVSSLIHFLDLSFSHYLCHNGADIGDATAYLSADAILRKLPAAVGSWAMSSFGPAYILGYRQEVGD
jgi:hypothetical protein